MTIRPLYDRIVVKRIEEKTTDAGRPAYPGFRQGEAPGSRSDGCRKGQAPGRWQDRAAGREGRRPRPSGQIRRAARSRWMVRMLLIIREDEVLGVLQGATKLAKAS